MARTIVGLGIGIGFVVFATYIAEIAPPSLRGRLILCQEIAQCVGVLATYTMAYVLKTDNWRLFAVSGGFIAIVQLIGLALLPESPRWLMMQDRVADAYQVMRRLGIDKTDLDSGESELRRSGTGVARHHVTSLLWTHRSELLTACFVGIAQNLLCLNAILYFSTDLFYLAQVCAPYEWGMGVGIVKLCGTLLIFPLVDTFGRRKLLLIGTGALFGANLLMAYAYGLSPMKNVASAEAFCESVQGADLGPTGLAGIHSVLMLVSLYLVVLCWEISWAGLMYVVASEIIPSTIRGIGMGIVIFFFWVSSFFSQLLFETLFDLITVIGTFVGLSIMALLVLVITYISVPDMTGKSLESIRRLMSGCNDNAMLEPYFTDAENGSFQQRDISPFARSTPSTTMSHIKRRQGPTENGVLSSKQDPSSDVSTLLSSS